MSFLPESLDKECLKATKILRSFRIPESNQGPDSLIPSTIIENAKGLVIMSVVKAGFLFSGRVGFGLVVSKLSEGNWSAPSAIGTASFGAGLQVGAEITDFVIILNNERAVNAFTHGGNVAVGGNLSVAAGPVGRNAEASGTATLAAIYSYSKTKGLFAGISLEGTVFLERSDANEQFYGRKVTAKELLSGKVEPPKAAKPLYDIIKLRAAHDEPPATSFNSSVANPNDPAHRRPVPPVPGAGGAPGGVVGKAKALYNFSPQQPGDLGFNAGDIIDVTFKTNNQDDWWKGNCKGKSGSFPSNYVELLK